jgi:hypothetical protein
MRVLEGPEKDGAVLGSVENGKRNAIEKMLPVHPSGNVVWVLYFRERIFNDVNI